jgi:hypothetical protein
MVVKHQSFKASTELMRAKFRERVTRSTAAEAKQCLLRSQEDLACPDEAQGISCTLIGWQLVCALCGENHRGGTPPREPPERPATNIHKPSLSCNMYGQLPPRTLKPASEALSLA